MVEAGRTVTVRMPKARTIGLYVHYGMPPLLYHRTLRLEVAAERIRGG